MSLRVRRFVLCIAALGWLAVSEGCVRLPRPMLADGSAVGDAASDVVAERAQDEDAAAVDGGPSDVAPSVDAADAADDGSFVVRLGYEMVPTCAPDAGADAGGPLLRTRCDFAGACCPAGQLCANRVCTEERSLHGGRDHMCLRVRDKVSCWGTAANGAIGPTRSSAVTEPPSLELLASSQPVYGMANYSLSNEFIIGANRSVSYLGGRHPFGDPDDTSGVAAPLELGDTAGMLELAQSSASGVRCGITLDRGVRCWGCNNEGALGDGQDPTPACAGSEARPTVFSINEGAPYAQVAVASSRIGDQYSAATVCALTARGLVRCWGANDFGQRGINRVDPQDDNRVTAAASSFVPMFQATEIAALSEAFCALSADGSVWCWGNRGSYGAANSFEARSSPERLRPAGAPMHQLRCGAGTCCAIEQRSRALYCWGVQDGANQRIVPGGPMTTGVAPTLIQPMDIQPGTIETVGVGDSICVVGLDRTMQRVLVCWGENDRGEATGVVSATPVGFRLKTVTGL